MTVESINNINPFTPTDRFSSNQNNEWKEESMKLLSVERVIKLPVV